LLEIAAGPLQKAFPNGTHEARGKTFAVDLPDQIARERNRLHSSFLS
jgi:hypothetical protein